MRKRSTYRPRHKSPPMLINCGLAESDIETRERMVVEAFSGGWANTNHYDTLADMRAVLVLAAAAKHDQSTLAICDAMKIPMANLRERYARHQRFGLTGDELQLLRVFVDQYRDFWIRQPVTLYVDACDGLNRAYQLGLVKEQA
ncbi:MAG: hypothetical protein ABFC42_10225 [Sulfuricella sp.]